MRNKIFILCFVTSLEVGVDVLREGDRQGERVGHAYCKGTGTPGGTERGGGGEREVTQTSCTLCALHRQDIWSVGPELTTLDGKQPGIGRCTEK